MFLEGVAMSAFKRSLTTGSGLPGTSPRNSGTTKAQSAPRSTGGGGPDLRQVSGKQTYTDGFRMALAAYTEENVETTDEGLILRHSESEVPHVSVAEEYTLV